MTDASKVWMPDTFFRSKKWYFLSDPGLSTGPIYGSGLCPTPFWNLTDVTLADKETNMILTDKVNRVIQGNVAMQVTQPGGQPTQY